MVKKSGLVKARAKLLKDDSALYTLGHFRASVCLDLCRMMGAKRVLDPCGGWGDRLTGCLAADTVTSIVIVEPRESACAAYEEQYEIVKDRVVRKRLEVLNGLAQHELKGMAERQVEPFDLIITSPPYHNLETYGDHANGKSAPQAANLATFFREMYDPMLEQMAKLLRDGGLLAINVDDNVTQEVHLVEHTIRMLTTFGLTFVGTAGLQKAEHRGLKGTKKQEEQAEGAAAVADATTAEGGDAGKKVPVAEPILLFCKGKAPTYTLPCGRPGGIPRRLCKYIAAEQEPCRKRRRF